jgi:hypothetical protein
MKNMTFLICIFFSVAINAQDISGIGNAPSTEVKIYHPSTDALIKLEKIVAVRKEKLNRGVMGVGASMRNTYEIEGEKSSLRLNADSAIFVIEQGTGMFAMDTGTIAFDASQFIMLYKLNVIDGKRVAIEADYKAGAGALNPLSLVSNKASSGGKVTDTRVTTTGRQLKKGLTQIIPKNRLEKGEYAFLGGGSAEDGDVTSTKNMKVFVFTFGID